MLYLMRFLLVSGLALVGLVFWWLWRAYVRQCDRVTALESAAEVKAVRSHSTGPHLMGGSVRASLQNAPDRDTLYREASAIASAGDFSAAADMVIAASNLKGD